MTIRRELEEIEEKILSPWAAKSSQTRGRLRKEDECPLRTAFQRDRDRIIHSKSFRRLKHKTQVFLSPGGDHYRTRLTHTLEVAQIARTMAKALRLNEDLTEAIALGHDLGHTPFGHAGEAILNELHPEGFRHYEQSLRVVDFLEKNGQGLNLTWEVRDGILKHSKGKGPILPDDTSKLAKTLEGQLVRVADIIAYLNHDLDDALRGGVIKERDIPRDCLKILGEKHSERINTMVKELIYATLKASDGKLHLSENIIYAMEMLRAFLFERVYEAPIVYNEFLKAKKLLKELYFYFLENEIPWDKENIYQEETPLHQKVCDFIAGMTDRYALALFEKYFVPKSWPI
ncbi:deoxyguanosinetriphosphate triphosphohydrolase [Thermodesulfatator atlanticus]|uniref:deoxyguanosinetriphosphate triphosphohydrolase n=1 Tax=Thermodesulfatator atlanticus TaxID=501497 RepID=UPI0003B75D6E|nr:deoxyguanosinetriphosphate triphosphohydrolase [Thermodesulfatator atlanticus]